MTKLFTKDTIVDEVLTEDARYNILEDGGTTFKSDMQIVLSTPVATPGTSVDADILNNLEDGVDAIDTRVDNNETTLNALSTTVTDSTALLTTGGTTTAYTLTTTGAASLATGERFRVKFNATAGSTPTLNRDSKGAKSLKYYDSTGAKIACGATSIISGMISDVVYDGTDYVVLDALQSAGGGSTITNSAITPTTTNVTAAVNTRYFADISGLTADRNFVLPVGTAGDEIELNITTGDDTYELVIIGNTGISINGNLH